MKTSLAKAIALAATLGTAASAQAAISLNHNGLGEVLLYPLYTVENGNDTAISVTNTTGEYKAVKVRFREALNSQDVLDFHVFLSPEDVWNGVVVATADGAKLITRDTSCTVPAIPADGANFTNIAYTGNAVETQGRGEDGGPQDLKRTRVGYVEVIELGVLDAEETTKAGVKFGTAIKHVNGVPGDCAAIVAEYETGTWSAGAGQDLNHGFLNDLTKLGGLYGVGTITNVFAGQQIGYDATALDDFIVEVGTAPNTTANLHNETGYSYPDLNGNRPVGTLGKNVAGIGASANATINGTEYSFSKTIDAVSAVLQKTSLMNEFSVDSAVGAGTDWAITFPTKHYYVWDSQIAADGTRTTTAPAAANVRPFEVNSLWLGEEGNAKANVTITPSYVDREEDKIAGGISFSPRPAAGRNVLSYEANVVTFSNSNILVAEDSYARYNWSNLQHKSGWATIALGGDAAQNVVVATASVPAGATGAELEFAGLPTIGFATIKVANGNLNGVLSNYNAAWNHKSQ